MIGKILKYFFIGLIGLIVVIAIFLIRARMEGEELYSMYNEYTQDMLKKNFQLKNYPIKEEFQTLYPWKALKLFKIDVSSQAGEKMARIISLNATMGTFMKMYTLLIRPNYNFNLPMFSVDYIFIGGNRVCVIEIIDPAHIADDNIKTHYEKMRARMPEIRNFEETVVDMDWAKDIVTDFSFHFKADRTSDDLIFDIYKTYLTTYLEMVKNAEPLSPDMSTKVEEGIEGYVNTLLAKGGPAVNVFKTLLGPEKQKEYVRTVMFGLD